MNDIDRLVGDFERQAMHERLRSFALGLFLGWLGCSTLLVILVLRFGL